MFPEFQEFKKIPRLSREIIITEKINGINGVIFIDENNNIFAGSRNRWLWSSEQNEIHNDNFGFAHWVKTNKEELLKLGRGYHYGEFWGSGIRIGYNLPKGERRFSLFNSSRWVKFEGNPILKEKQEYCPECCNVVPILYEGIFNTVIIDEVLDNLSKNGSIASPGFFPAEGVIIYHIAAKQYFKKTIINDEKPKGVTNE